MNNIILRLKDVQHKTGLSRSTIYYFISQGTFPKQISLSSKICGWLESEIEEWILYRIEQSKNIKM
jgi:prophage regulatory protein